MNENLKEYIGFKLDDIMPLLLLNETRYKIIEVWDNKKTKMGNDKRIINIKNNGIVEIYIAYF
jgi:hypothetical protein